MIIRIKSDLGRDLGSFEADAVPRTADIIKHSNGIWLVKRLDWQARVNRLEPTVVVVEIGGGP